MISYLLATQHFLNQARSGGLRSPLSSLLLPLRVFNKQQKSFNLSISVIVFTIYRGLIDRDQDLDRGKHCAGHLTCGVSSLSCCYVDVISFRCILRDL